MSSSSNPVAVAATTVETTESVPASTTPLLDSIVAQGRFGRETQDSSRGKDLISEFIDDALKGHMTFSHGADAVIAARIAQIDALISKQLNEVLHAKEFKALEATWRGVDYLMRQTRTSSNLKIKLFNAPKKDLTRDLQRARSFEQSQLFTKVYEEEFGVLGGEPIAALVGDYEFSRSPEDLDLLEKVATVAAAAHAPFLSAADPSLMGMEDFTQLPGVSDMSKIFDTAEYAKWKSFRQSEDSRYVALTLPHMLMRLPYGKGNTELDAFNFEEGVDGKDHSKYLWGNAAYGLAARITNSFSNFGWCSTIRGVESGGVVDGLPTHTFHNTDIGDTVLKCPTEVQITDRREKELADQGFVPLVHRKGSDNAVFMSVQSVNKPKTYNTPDANRPTRSCPRSCRTSWRCRALRII